MQLNAVGETGWSLPRARIDVIIHNGNGAKVNWFFDGEIS